MCPPNRASYCIAGSMPQPLKLSRQFRVCHLRVKIRVNVFRGRAKRQSAAPLRRERLSDMLLVLPNPASQISRDSDVQRSTVAGQNVNLIAALCSHARGVFRSYGCSQSSAYTSCVPISRSSSNESSGASAKDRSARPV